MRSYLAEDTVAALASAVGGALAIIRVSGPRSRSIAAALCPSLKDPSPRKLVRASLRSGSAPLDDALCAFFPSPDSYTGEDVVEFHVHGGGFVARRVLEALLRQGARAALPGEFSFRAVRNGKMTISQAQGVADLIAASNDDAVALALERISGSQNELVVLLARELREVAALSEAGIDFSDQDLDEVALPRLKSRVLPVLEKLRLLAGSFERGFRLQNGVGVTFVGLPNAGKSSFFNALLGEDRSIVSSSEGTTRDLVRETLSLRGEGGSVTLRLEDTAGLRSTDDPVEEEGVRRTLRAAHEAELILFLVDPAHSWQKISQQWEALGKPAEKTLGILTKSDLLHAPEKFMEKAAAWGLRPWLSVSAVTGQGIQSCIDAIISQTEGLVRRDKGELLLTRMDQVSAAEAAASHLTRALAAAEQDLFAADLRQGLAAMGPLIGETPSDMILEKIFSDFCIGK